MPPETLATLPGYDPDIAKNRGAARKIMEKLGYAPDHRLAVTLSSRQVNNLQQAKVPLSVRQQSLLDTVLQHQNAIDRCREIKIESFRDSSANPRTD